MGFEVIMGIALVTALMLYMLFNLKRNAGEENKHFLLQLMLLFFVAGGFLLMAKATMDADDPCSWNVVNSTSLSGYDVYNYEYQCVASEYQTSGIFYNGTLWFVRILFLYVFLYFVYEILKFAGWVVPK